MLNNMDWLKVGKEFPPKSEQERLERYRENKLIFENKHNSVYSQQWKRIEKVVGNTSEIISYPIVLNFQKKLSLKVADFLFMEKPEYTTKDENKKTIIDEICELSDIDSIGYEGAIDCSRFGDAVYKIDTTEGGKGKISISTPEFLFIIVDPADKKKVLNYVIAWTYAHEASDKLRNLTVVVHGAGSYQIHDCIVSKDDKKIIRVEQQEVVQTGLSDFAVIPIHNLTTSDSVYGIDDYMDIDSIVSELEIRTAQVSKILDALANPPVSGSERALEPDGYGGYVFRGGNYYTREDSQTPQLEYITWNAQLDQHFKQIEKLLNYLSTISEMGAAIFNDEMKTGNIPSGSALKKLYINALAKVARLRNNFDTGLKKAIALASEAGYGLTLDYKDISIVWKDGLPQDVREEAEIAQIRTGGKATMSIRRVLMEYDGLDKKTADNELEQIEDDEMSVNPMQTPEFDKNYNDDEEGEGEE